MTSDILITGIPRSGTSYLCSVLNQVRNTVVVNEPEEVLQILRNESPLPLARLHEFIRARVNAGQPIVNKIVNGKFIEDTNIIDARNAYIPETDRADFLLGTKNTLIYLNCLDKLEKTFPKARVVACVRHPRDTIASWSRVSFPHLKNAAPRFLLNYVDDDARRTLGTILQTPDLAKRYAMLWNHLANIILNHMDRLLLVHYEKMVTDPQGTLAGIYESISFPLDLRLPPEPSSPRHHQDSLSTAITNAMEEYCKDSAAALGYQL